MTMVLPPTTIVMRTIIMPWRWSCQRGVGLNDNDIVLLAPAYLVQSIMLWCWSCQSLNKQAAGCKTLLGQHLAKITMRKQPQRFCTKHTSALQYLQYHCRIATITFEFSHHCNCMDSTEAVSSSCTTLQNRYNYI